jgi:hypothetical protein
MMVELENFLSDDVMLWGSWSLHTQVTISPVLMDFENEFTSSDLPQSIVMLVEFARGANINKVQTSRRIIVTWTPSAPAITSSISQNEQYAALNNLSTTTPAALNNENEINAKETQHRTKKAKRKNTKTYKKQQK